MANGLGLCSDASLDDAGDALSPVRLQSGGTDELRFIRPVQVACGAAHTVLAAGDGYRLWAWGRGRSGVLGTGHMTDSFVPCSIMWPPPNNVFEDEGLMIDDNRSIPQDEDPLSAALAEVQLLQSKLSLMERYASVLHVSVFGRVFREQDIPPSLQESNFFDIRRELENTMDSADDAGLAQMEVFYRSMLASVNDRMMKRRIQEIVKECLASLPKESQLPPR